MTNLCLLLVALSMSVLQVSSMCEERLSQTTKDMGSLVEFEVSQIIYGPPELIAAIRTDPSQRTDAQKELIAKKKAEITVGFPYQYS
jgi:hypothetical protein